MGKRKRDGDLAEDGAGRLPNHKIEEAEVVEEPDSSDPFQFVLRAVVKVRWGNV